MKQLTNYKKQKLTTKKKKKQNKAKFGKAIKC